jgi:putative YphP/YqiW family bacilliredoxin
MYPLEIVNPCRAELTNNGFQSLESSVDVDQFFSESNDDVSLMVINSVCGCAAGSARPGVLKSLNSDKKPARLATVFAGVDKEAVSKAREFMLPYPPSSPSIAIFKGNQLIHFIERHHIEGRSADMIAEHLKAAYQQFCS